MTTLTKGDVEHELLGIRTPHHNYAVGAIFNHEFHDLNRTQVEIAREISWRDSVTFAATLFFGNTSDSTSDEDHLVHLNLGPNGVLEVSQEQRHIINRYFVRHALEFGLLSVDVESCLLEDVVVILVLLLNLRDLSL
jgi:hypothetical protein